MTVAVSGVEAVSGPLDMLASRRADVTEIMLAEAEDSPGQTASPLSSSSSSSSSSLPEADDGSPDDDPSASPAVASSLFPKPPPNNWGAADVAVD